MPDELARLRAALRDDFEAVRAIAREIERREAEAAREGVIDLETVRARRRS